MNLFSLFFSRYFFSKRGGAIIRTMARLCWVATLIGVFSLVVVSSIMNGFNRSIRHKLLSVQPHLTVQGSPQDIAVLRDIHSRYDIVEKGDYYEQDVIIRTLDGRFSAGVAKGLGLGAINGFLERIEHLKYKDGSAHTPQFESRSVSLSDREIMLGADLARDLNLFEGDEILLIPPETLLAPSGEALRYARVRVARIFTTEFSEIDGRTLYFKFTGEMPAFYSAASHTKGLEWRLKSPDQFEDLKVELQAAVGGGQDLVFESWADQNRALFMALRLEKIAMTTFLGLSILITCFSLITVLVMLISQKRKEIGLLMSIGLSEQKTKRLFLILGLLLSGLGLFGGLAIGVLTSVLIDKYPIDVLPDIYFDSSLPAELNFVFISWVAVFCIVIAFAAAYLPVRLYLRYSPSENLRRFVTE